MHKFTLFLYILPRGTFHTPFIEAETATAAYLAYLAEHALEKNECELIAAVRGKCDFVEVDRNAVQLAPF